MPSSPTLIRALGALLAAAGVVVLGGCALTTEKADTERGRVLFQANCGSCHVLAEAQTQGTQGPDLDAAFAVARADGMDGDTIEGIVKAQTENPRPSVDGEPAISMPAGLVGGQDLDDVAAYIASVAGVPGIEPPPFAAPTYFASTCGGCHALQEAQTAGTLGPDLDEVLPGQSIAQISASITDPSAELTPGFPNAMPQDIAAGLSPPQLQALVDYLVDATGGGSGGGNRR
jgi:mono/diheme cytochrome c family protein